MSYDYAKERDVVFTDSGQRALLAMRDHARKAFQVAGAITAEKLMDHADGVNDSWTMLALVDRLVEIGDLKETPANGMTQDRVFVPGGSWWR